MKKIFIVIISIFINVSYLYAEDRNSELNRLFDELKIKDKNLSFKIEQKIWKIWSTHPNNNELTSMLSDGSDFVNNNQYLEAIEIFTKVIELDHGTPSKICKVTIEEINK